MPEFTPRGIRYPVPADAVKVATSASKLANDIRDTAITADGALNSVLAEAIADSTTKYGGLPARVTAVETKNTEQDHRLVDLEFTSPELSSNDQDLLVSVVSADYRRTWLEAEAESGYPSTHSKEILSEVLGPQFDTSGNGIGAFTDAAGRYTDVHLDSEGHIDDRVMDLWAPRLASRLGVANGGLSSGDRMLVGGELVPVFPDTANITTWGSSSIDRITGALEVALVGTGTTLHNEGVGGELIEEHAARLGSTPALITIPGGSIPASGTIAVTSPMRAVLKPYTGTLAGVPGTLGWPGQVHGQLTFTRTGSGDVTAVPAGTPFIPDIGMASRNHVTFLWAGKSDLAEVGKVNYVVTETNKMFDFLTPMVKRALVLGHFINSDRSPANLEHVQATAVNAAYKARYGDLYVDVAGYLASPQVWIDTGITPTATDLTQQANGVKPVSLSSDNGHLNAAGYTAVAKLIFGRLSALGWY